MDLFNSADFASRVDELIKQHHVPGIAIAIVQEETVASAGYGMATIDPPKPCTPDTLFDIASASKSLTAASVGLLVDDQENYPEVRYETTMSSLLPDDFVMTGEGYTQGVTVEDTLSHRTGMASHDSSYMGVHAAQPDDAQSVTRNLRNLAVAAPIRSKFIYCNMMYTVATHLVEKLTGVSFSNFLHERFFKPLGMDSTSLQPEEARSKGLGDRIATAYSWEDDGEYYRDFSYLDCPEAQGAGSILTSVNDYVKYVKAIMNHEDPFTEEVCRGLVKLRTFQNPNAENLAPFTSPAAYAAGWEVYYYRGHMIVNHDGCIPGSATCHFFLPDLRFGGAIFGNAADGAGIVKTVLARELIDEALKVPHVERPDWNAFESKLQADEDGDDGSSLHREEELRQKLCSAEITNNEPEYQKKPLETYVGEYWNPGYHRMTVQVKDDRLFIDAADRSEPFTLAFEHVCGQSKYIARFRNYFEGFEDLLRAEFGFEDGRVVKMGLHLEDELEELIWFDRIQDSSMQRDRSR